MQWIILYGLMQISSSQISDKKQCGYHLLETVATHSNNTASFSECIWGIEILFNNILIYTKPDNTYYVKSGFMYGMEEIN